LSRPSESEGENSSKKSALKNENVFKRDPENLATGIRTKKAAARPKKSAVKASTKVKEQPALDRIREQEFGTSGGASCGAAANSPLTSVKLGTPISSSDLYRRIFMDESPGTTPNIPNKRSRAVVADRNDRSLLDESQHFVGDLSVILDEIISGHNLPPQSVDLDSPAPGQHRGHGTSSESVVNSTRIDHQPVPGSKDTSLSPAKCQESEIEDSFDRMCY